MIEPSDVERSEWPDATRGYVEALEEKLSATARGVWQMTVVSPNGAMRTVLVTPHFVDQSSFGPVRALMAEIGPVIESVVELEGKGKPR